MWKCVWVLFFCHHEESFGELLKHELLGYDPSPNPESVVDSSDSFLRITILTNKLFRIQTGPHFDDKPSLAVIHRNLATPDFTVNRANSGGISVKTDSAEVFYREGSKNLNSHSFQAENKQTRQTYRYGEAPSGNLFGTIRTLDTLGPTYLNCTEFQDPDAHCEFGLVSRDGWAIINDTNSARLQGENDWWAEKQQGGLDFYLFMHGKDFKGALSDYSKIGGRVPLPPKYMLGVLWTRWYDLDSKNVKELIDEFERTNTPIDTVILDMNWHAKPWWGGFSFDRRIIPNPKKLMSHIHSRNLSIGLNIHDCLLAERGCPSGTLSQEDDLYSALASKIGINGLSAIPLDLLNETSALAKEDLVIRSFEGLTDMLWIDWQQGDTGVGNLSGGSENPTIWLNKMRYTNRKRWGSKTRGAVLSRYGGLGSQRYGTGFSGDVQMLDWDNLSYQPYFTATAANVLFQWSHDITGPNRDPELLVRWTQWGAFSPVLRFHERGMSSGPCAYASFPHPGKDCATVNVWETLPGRFRQAVRESLELREELVPYIYTEAFKLFKSGIPWMRPLYHDFPEEGNSYLFPSQYMFGDLITVAPIVRKSASETPSTTEWTLYVPPGTWYSPQDGFLLNGNSTYSRFWDLSEVPYLVKAGSIIPRRNINRNASRLGLAARNYTDLIFEVIPGSSNGTISVYEDDGTTTEYTEGLAGWIHAKYERRDGAISIEISLEGKFSLSIHKRSVKIRLLDSPPFRSAPGCSVLYDGEKLTASLDFEWDVIAEGKSIKKIGYFIESDSNLAGIKGAVAHARLAKNALDEAVLTPGTHPCWHEMPCGYRPQDDNLIRAAIVGELLEQSDKNFDATISDFVRWYKTAVSREVTIENILRTDNLWAPTQGGWTEQTRLRANYAVETIRGALEYICRNNPTSLILSVCPTHHAHAEHVIDDIVTLSA